MLERLVPFLSIIVISSSLGHGWRTTSLGKCVVPYVVGVSDLALGVLVFGTLGGLSPSCSWFSPDIPLIDRATLFSLINKKAKHLHPVEKYFVNLRGLTKTMHSCQEQTQIHAHARFGRTEGTLPRPHHSLPLFLFAS
jgi:hypothetical protein